MLSLQPRTKNERSTGLRAQRRNDLRPFSPKIFLAIGTRRLWTLSLPSLRSLRFAPLSPRTPLCSAQLVRSAPLRSLISLRSASFAPLVLLRSVRYASLALSAHSALLRSTRPLRSAPLPRSLRSASFAPLALSAPLRSVQSARVQSSSSDRLVLNFRAKGPKIVALWALSPVDLSFLVRGCRLNTLSILN